jgi:hypothetical protein
MAKREVHDPTDRSDIALVHLERVAPALDQAKVITGVHLGFVAIQPLDLAASTRPAQWLFGLDHERTLPEHDPRRKSSARAVRQFGALPAVMAMCDLPGASSANCFTQLVVRAAPTTDPFVVNPVLGTQWLAKNLVCVPAADV